MEVLGRVEYVEICSQPLDEGLRHFLGNYWFTSRGHAILVLPLRSHLHIRSKDAYWAEGHLVLSGSTQAKP